jgi:hypothetical protein
LNLTTSTNIKDNQFTKLLNFYYNKDKQPETRRWYTTFGNNIGTAPITSYFFYQRDDSFATTAVCDAGTAFYKYDETSNTWNSVHTGLHEYETIPALSANRTRRDYAVYKNIIYMGNWVDNYASYDGTTYTNIGAGTPVVCTFDNTTDTVLKVAHWLTINSEVEFTTTWTLPTWITANTYYYVINPNANDFQISTSKWGSAVNFTTNGTGTNSYLALTEPRVRYVSYLADRLFGAGDDGNPISLYYTNAAPADWTNLNQNTVVIGGDEWGRINGLSELQQVILAFKNQKIYSVNVTTPSALALDAQTWGYSDRCIQNVENSLLYFNERWVDTLQARYWVAWANALASKQLSDNIRRLINDIQPAQYNAGAARYSKSLNNYYFVFDTNDDNIPDKFLVYSSLVWSWSEYNLPNIYDFGEYITSDQAYYLLFASAITGQMFRFEYGFDDNGVTIDYELETKKFDFDTPWLYKTFDYIDIVWLKNIGSVIDVYAMVDWAVATQSQITDANIDMDSVAKTIGSTPIGIEPLTWPEDDVEIPLYRFTFRVPLYATGTNVSINMQSAGWVWILEKMRISKDDEPVDVFSYANIG